MNGDDILFWNGDMDALTFNRDAYQLLTDMAKSQRSVDHIITDPPYNISKKNNFASMKSAKRQGVYFGDWDKQFDLTGWIPAAADLLLSGGTFIVFNSYRNLSEIIEKMESCGLVVKDVIKWVKTNPMPRNVNRRYVQDTEYAVWAVKPRDPWIFNKPESEPYLRAEYRTPVVSGKERTIHPTQKSVALMKQIIKVHTNENDIIFDPFMGSGTTGVAAIETGRRFVGCELNKEYYDIAKKRISEAR